MHRAILRQIKINKTLHNIVIAFFVESCPIIQQQCQRPEATTYSRRRASKTL